MILLIETKTDELSYTTQIFRIPPHAATIWCANCDKTKYLIQLKKGKTYPCRKWQKLVNMRVCYWYCSLLKEEEMNQSPFSSKNCYSIEILYLVVLNDEQHSSNRYFNIVPTSFKGGKLIACIKYSFCPSVETCNNFHLRQLVMSPSTLSLPNHFWILSCYCCWQH